MIVEIKNEQFVSIAVHKFDTSNFKVQFGYRTKEIEYELDEWLTTEPGQYVKKYSVVKPAVKRRYNIENDDLHYEVIAFLRPQDATLYTLTYL
jgi:hypothetical protein